MWGWGESRSRWSDPSCLPRAGGVGGEGPELLQERSRGPPFFSLLSPAGLLAVPRQVLPISEMGGGRASLTFCEESEVEELRAVEEPGQRGLS